MFHSLKDTWRGLSCGAEAGRAARIDPGALSVLRALEQGGEAAYLVGGCVRDLLMGRTPADWDIASSARPEAAVRILSAAGFRCADGGGRRYGTVIAAAGGASYEVTAFRRDVYGGDAHRPASVSFADTLEEDLARRDFTVNAMAMDGSGRLYDPFGGAADIRQKRLRTVGDAAARFSEDALRLFRACRFLGQLDFMAAPELAAGMAPAFSRVRGLSLARVRSEIEKLLVADHAGRGLDLLVRTGLAEESCRVREAGREEEIGILPELSHLVGLPQMKAFHRYDGWYHTLAVVEAAPKDRLVRWAALLHDVGKGMPGVRRVEGEKITDYNHDAVGAAMTEALLRRWRFPEREVRLLSWLVANHMKFHFFANNDSADVVKWVRRLARERIFPDQKQLVSAIGMLTALCRADVIGCGRPASATEGHEAFGQCMADTAASIPVTAKELHYDRRTVEILGPAVGDGLSNFLLRVQNGVLDNTEEALYTAARHFRKRHGYHEPE